MFEIHSTLCTSKERTYAIRIVNIWADLTRLPLLRGWLGIDHAVWCNKPIARAYGFTVIISNIKLQGSHVWELRGVSNRQRGNCTLHAYRDKAHQIIIGVCDNVAKEEQKEDAGEYHLGRSTAPGGKHS